MTPASTSIVDAYALAGIYIHGEPTLSDDKSNRGPQDRSRISLTEDYEVDYWTKALGISEDRLREAVGRVGNGADAVRAELARRGQS